LDRAGKLKTILAIAAMLMTTADPDKERFKECMEAQAAATNMAEATNGPEVWPLWAKLSKDECAELLAKIINEGWRRCVRERRCK
jgi:hypothetical protein